METNQTYVRKLTSRVCRENAPAFWSVERQFRFQKGWTVFEARMSRSETAASMVNLLPGSTVQSLADGLQ